MKKIILTLVALVALCGVAQSQRHIEFRWRGIYLVGDLTYGANLNKEINDFTQESEKLSAIMPTITGGFQFRKEAGVGLGVSYVADATGAFTQMPIFAELRSHYTRAQLTPYSVLQVGYTLPLGTSSVANPYSRKIEEGGLYVGVEAGARYAFNRSMALAVHLTYRLLQSNSVMYRDGNGVAQFNDPVVMHVLGGGVSFYFSNWQ